MSVSVMWLLLVVANICGAGMIVPQVVRLRRTGDAAGVSAAWTGVGLGLNLWWAAYAVAEQLWGLLPVSVVALFLYAAMAWELRLLEGGRLLTPSGGATAIGGTGLGVLSTTVPPALALLIGGWTGVGLTLGVAYAVQFLPALASVVGSVVRTGVSSLTWIMALTEASIWMLYGWSLADPALVIGGMGGGLAAGAILMVLARTRLVLST